jgi:thiosulfate dehydrogenase
MRRMSLARTKPSFFLTSLPVLAFVVSGCGTNDPEIKQASAADHGAALFLDPTLTGTAANAYSCATCHFTRVPASTTSGPILTGAPLAGVTRRPSYWGGQEVELLRSLNNCLYYFMLENAPVEATDERAEALFAYLDSLPSSPEDEKPWPFTIEVEVQPIALGQASTGKALYERSCQSCHGAPKTGDNRLVPRAPILPDQTLAQHPLGTYTEEERRLVFVQKTRHGGFLGYGGQMPPYSKEILSDEALGDILAYMGVP